MLLERRLKRQRTREANRAAKETAVEEEPEAQAATESRDARAERRAQAKHAGSRAVAMRAAAEGDLNITPTERQEIDDLISCKHKDQQYKQQRKEAYQTSSAGVLALISACGLFLAVDELYGAESLSQVRRATPSCPAPPPCTLVFRQRALALPPGAPLSEQDILPVEAAGPEGARLRRRVPPPRLFDEPRRPRRAVRLLQVRVVAP